MQVKLLCMQCDEFLPHGVTQTKPAHYHDHDQWIIDKNNHYLSKNITNIRNLWILLTERTLNIIKSFLKYVQQGQRVKDLQRE